MFWKKKTKETAGCFEDMMGNIRGIWDATEEANNTTNVKELLDAKSLKFLCNALNEFPDPATLYPAEYNLAESPKDKIQVMLQEAIYDKKCTFNEIIDALCGEHRERKYVRQDNPLATGYVLPRGDDFVLARLSSPFNSGTSYDDRVIYAIIYTILILAECAAEPITRSTAKMYAEMFADEPNTTDFEAQLEVAHSMPVSVMKLKKKIGLTTQEEELFRDYVPNMPSRLER